MKSLAIVSVVLLALTQFACSDSGRSSDNNADSNPIAAPAPVVDSTTTLPPAEATTGEGDAIAEPPATPPKDSAADVIVYPVVALGIDATSKTAWTHFDLDSGKVVAETDVSWDLAFKRTSIKMNSNVKAQVLRDTAFEAVAAAPAGAYTADAPVVGGPETDGLFFHTPSPWYEYNMETHVISPRNSIYVVKSNGGHDVKVQIVDYYNADRLPAFIQTKSHILGLSAAAE
ncbi:MAG: HmuY family protein [Bdellovibrionota bacterium]|nr:MAG: hypothetical protein EOP10_27720 [Pseudomonadota bacterium]